MLIRPRKIAMVPAGVGGLRATPVATRPGSTTTGAGSTLTGHHHHTRQRRPRRHGG